MSRALHCIEIAGLVGVTFLWGMSTASAGNPSWGRLQSGGSVVGISASGVSASNPVYYYNNAAPAMTAPTTTTGNSTSITYRSYSAENGSSSGFYYYSPGPCGCYSYAPGPSPTAASTAATPNGAAPTATAATAPNGGYRSFSPDSAATPTATPNNDSSYPGTYYRSTSSSGRSWGSRGR